MEIYKKSKNIFLSISILLLILAFTLLYFFELEILSSLLFGISASAIVITIQCAISYKIEVSRSLTPYMKELIENVWSLKFAGERPIDSHIYDYPSYFSKIKDEIEKVRKVRNILCDFDCLDKKVCSKINLVAEEIKKLEEKTYLIFVYYNDANDKQKICLYLELLNILGDFDFEKLDNNIFSLAWLLDPSGFLSESAEEQNDDSLYKLKHKNSKEVYLRKIEKSRELEYEALKKDFDAYAKFRAVDEKPNKDK